MSASGSQSCLSQETGRPEVWQAFRMLWHELGFCALPAGQVLAVLDDLMDPSPPMTPSTGKPGRHPKHGLYSRGAAAGGPLRQAQDEVTHG
jgi:hypothetical protein